MAGVLTGEIWGGETRGLQLFDQGGLQPFQAGLAGGFATGDQDGLGVGGPEQPPAIGGADAHAVDIGELGAGGFEAGGDLGDDGEFARVGTIEPQFRGVDDLRQGFADRGHGLGAARENAEHADAGVECVVEAIPFVGEEDVAGHFPGQRAAGFGHAGFDQAVAGLPHFRLAAGAGDFIGMVLPLVLIMGVFYFLLIRPQQKKMKEHQEMLKKVGKGDTIITSGGLIGRVVKVIDDNELQVEIGENIKVRVMRTGIADVRAKGEPVKTEAK